MYVWGKKSPDFKKLERMDKKKPSASYFKKKHFSNSSGCTGRREGEVNGEWVRQGELANFFESQVFTEARWKTLMDQ